MIVNPFPPLEKIFGSLAKVKILELLAKEGELNVTAISKRVGANHSRMKMHLEDLKSLKLIEEKKFGKIRIFQINEKTLAGKTIKDFIIHWIRGYEVVVPSTEF